MRIAIVGTPRSGNSLLRKTLARAYGLAEAASHDPNFLCGRLPDDTVFQVHARYSTTIHRALLDQRVLIVTPSRHPLDVALSMLHFAQFEPEVAGWLGGDYLRDLEGCDPTSRAFREFVLGPGFGELLGVSVGWWPHAHIPITYAELCRQPLRVLASEALGAHRVVTSDPTLADAGSFEHFRSSANMHGWMGRQGYWTQVISTEFAAEVRNAHLSVFRPYGIVDAQELEKSEIRVRWAREFGGIVDGGQQAAPPHQYRLFRRHLVRAS